MVDVGNEDQPRITAAELAEVITKHPDWANLPVHLLNLTDEAVWLTEIEWDCFDVNEGPVLSLLAHAPAVPSGQSAPSYGVVLARAEAAERQADELLAEVEHRREAESERRLRADQLGDLLSISEQARNAEERDRRNLGAANDDLRARLAEAATLLGHFVDHEDQPCQLNHHGACEAHGGSELRPCDVASGRELLVRIRGGRDA